MMAYEAFMDGRDRDSYRSRGERIERLTCERDEARAEVERLRSVMTAEDAAIVADVQRLEEEAARLRAVVDAARRLARVHMDSAASWLMADSDDEDWWLCVGCPAGAMDAHGFSHYDDCPAIALEQALAALDAEEVDGE